jgi:type VI secretion system protein ImpL
VVRRLPSTQGPYYALIHRIAAEFQAMSNKRPSPSWVGLAYDWQEVSRESRSRSAIDFEKAGLLRKATRQVTSKIKKAERAFGVKVRAPMDSEAQLHAAKALLAYQQALEAMVKAIDSRHVAFDMASALYQQDPATGDSPFLAANRAVADLKTIMADAQDDAEALFWDLINGNNRFMQTYVNREAACHLQALWEKQVLLELQDVSADRDMAQVMMGSDGYATQFIRGPAAPFVTRSLAKGYHATRAMGLEIPFDTVVSDLL